MYVYIIYINMKLDYIVRGIRGGHVYINTYVIFSVKPLCNGRDNGKYEITRHHLLYSTIVSKLAKADSSKFETKIEVTSRYV